MKNDMKYIYRDHLENECEIEEIREILEECDQDFCPPLSFRSGTQQTSWSAAESKDAKNGIEAYLSDLKEQSMLILKSEQEIIAFLSCRTPYTCEYTWQFEQVCYLTTLCIRKSWRKKGLSLKLYERMLAELYQRYPDHMIVFRTWSTNQAQLHIAGVLGFSQIACLENDRGEGIHTLYFARKPFWNDITDVPGVRVGQTSINEGKHHTGVTVIMPCDGFVFEKKPLAASYVLNGFGKTMGTVQLEELGVLETPIALTNTLNVGKVADGIVQYILEEGKKKDVRITSINPVVGETNDSRINLIEERVVTEQHVLQAISEASKKVEQGAVGAGTGTLCFGLKGGIGSSARRIRFGDALYTIGVLVQSNFGRMEDLTIHGEAVGSRISKQLQAEQTPEKGSIMVVLGTDLPLTQRQLKRVLKRAGAGLARLGSYYGHGSGDVFLGFTNGNFLPNATEEEFVEMRAFPENQIDLVFRNTVDAVEEAVLNSMLYAEAATGLDGTVYHSLSEFYPDTSE